MAKGGRFIRRKVEHWRIYSSLSNADSTKVRFSDLIFLELIELTHYKYERIGVKR